MFLYVVKEVKQKQVKNNRPAMLKIGIAKEPEKRLKGLQTSNPTDLTILHLVKCKSKMHAQEMERYFHWKLQNWHIRGEWFRGDALGMFNKHMMGFLNHTRARRVSGETTTALWEMI